MLKKILFSYLILALDSPQKKPKDYYHSYKDY